MHDHVAADGGFLVGLLGGVSGPFGVAGDFMDGAGHFVHGGGHQLGFQTLAVHAFAGFFGDMLKLIRGAGEFVRAAVNLVDDIPQVAGHVLHRPGKLADFIFGVDIQVDGQVADGHLVHSSGCPGQGIDYTLGHYYGDGQAQYQRGKSGDDDFGVGRPDRCFHFFGFVQQRCEHAFL